MILETKKMSSSSSSCSFSPSGFLKAQLHSHSPRARHCLRLPSKVTLLCQFCYISAQNANTVVARVLVTRVIRPSCWHRAGSVESETRDRGITIWWKEEEKGGKKHRLEKPERIHSVRVLVVVGLLKRAFCLNACGQSPSGRVCERTRWLTAAGMLRLLLSAWSKAQSNATITAVS